MGYRRPREKGESFFFTVAAGQGLPSLCEPSGIRSLTDAIRSVRSSRPFSLNAFVLLPDHLHCIWTMPRYDPDFAGRWAEIEKRFTAGFSCAAGPCGRPGRAAGAGIWRPGLGERYLRDDADFVRHVEYIHFNPVQHGLVSDPRSWPHSTFLDYVKRGLYRPDWGCGSAVRFGSDVGGE